MSFKKLFGNKKLPIIGMIHVGALPGTPYYGKQFEAIVQKACQEAHVYRKHNIDGIIVENMHDIPYVKSNYYEPEIVASMTRICTEIRQILPKTTPCGIQILAGKNIEAIAVAKISNLQFIRCEGFIFGHVADEGYIDACAGSLLRYRSKIDAQNILILADIKKKHSSHTITSDINLIETAKAADFFKADGVIITGKSTGDPANDNELQQLKKNLKIPVLIGSGIDRVNLHKYQIADGLIVGSTFKKDGKWENDICEERLTHFLENVYTIREKFLINSTT